MAASPRAKTAPDESRSIPADRAAADVDSQAIFRQVNEEISRIATSFAVEQLELVCECEHGDCFARVSIAPDDYEAVRRVPTRFLIKPEHVGADEQVVAETPGYAVVEKIGRSAAAAILLDPRTQTAGAETK